MGMDVGHPTISPQPPFMHGARLAPNFASWGLLEPVYKLLAIAIGHILQGI